MNKESPRSEICGCVICGFPSPGEENREGTLDFNEYIIKHPSTTFCLRAYGQSMYPEVKEGDIVVVDRSLAVKDGDLIVAEYAGDFTLKYYKKTKTGVFLVPENPKFKAIEINNETRLFGVVTAIVRKTRV